MKDWQITNTVPMLLTYREAAELLNVGVDSLRREVKRGRVRILYPRPGCPRFAPDDLEAYVAKLRGTVVTPSS